MDPKKVSGKDIVVLRIFRYTFCRSIRQAFSSSLPSITPSVRSACTLLAWLALCSTGYGQESEETYKDAWTRGEYQRALVILEEGIAAEGDFVQFSLLHAKSKLLFETGSVDEAIALMERIVDRYPKPSNTLELALMYEYRGRIADYDAALQRAARQASQLPRNRYRPDEEYLVAYGRLLELVLNENPKTTLRAYWGQIIQRQPEVIGAYIAAGNLSYKHSGYAVAARYFNQAIELEPNNQEALAGLAECYWKSHDERLAPTLQRLMDINPNHPRAIAIQVEKFLELLEIEPALALIESALAINPRSLRFLSLRSAAHFLDDDQDAMLETQLDVLKFNPVYSEVFRTTGRLASRHYRFKEGAMFQERALLTDPNDYQARAEYTLDLMRLGREQEGRAELQKAAEADPYNVLLFNLLNLMDTLETFTTIERGSFVLRIPETEAPVLAEDMLEMLQHAFDYYEARYAVEIEEPVLIELFDNHDDFMVRSVGLPGNAGHLGICFGKLVTMDAPSVRAKGSSNWQSVLWHEFVHVVTLQKTKNQMPRWLSEGISVYEEGQRSPAWRTKLDPTYRAIVAGEEPPGVKDIGVFFTRPKSPGHLMFGYFIAGEFVQFYTEAYGFEALVDTLDRIRNGTDTGIALADAAKTETAELDNAFAEYFENCVAPYENLPEMAIANQPDESDVYRHFPGLRPGSEGGNSTKSAFGDAMKLATESMRDENWPAAVAALEKAHELFPDYTGPDAPLRQLATLYADQGNKVALKETLLRQIEWTPTELVASLALVKLFDESKDWKPLVDAARLALAVDPYDIATRGRLVEGLKETGELDAALAALDVLMYLDSGNATEHRLERVEVQTAAGDWEAARQGVVALLEEFPHYWEAQRLLLEITEHSESVETPRVLSPLNQVNAQ